MPLTNAQRQARHRAKQPKVSRTPLTQTKYAALPGPLPAVVGNANIRYCPFCEGYKELVKVNRSSIVARKGCKNCKRKFDYIRRDTPEGRAAYEYQRRMKSNALETVRVGVNQLNESLYAVHNGDSVSTEPFAPVNNIIVAF